MVTLEREKTAIGTGCLNPHGGFVQAGNRRFLRAFVGARLLVQNVQYVQGKIPFQNHAFARFKRTYWE